jgi:hypothetical protein
MPPLEHCVAVKSDLWHNLRHVPVLDDFAIVIEAKNIHTCPVPIFIGWPLLVAMQDHVIAFGKYPFEVDALARVLLCHFLEVRNECFLAIHNMGIVPPVHGTRVSLYRLRLALVEHEVAELFGQLLIYFESIIHGGVRAVISVQW